MARNVMLAMLLALFPVATLFPQEVPVPLSCKPVYFDVSPPLRNLKMRGNENIDGTWKEGAVPNFVQTRGVMDSLVRNVEDTSLQTRQGYVSPGSILLNFEGMANINHASPPDTYGDVGPQHYLQLVNLSFSIYNKSGQLLLGPFSTGSIWEGLPNNTNWGDGIVQYDEQADRWLISQFSFPNFPLGPFYEMIAVSQTPDPTGSWYRWEYAFGDLPDYPKFGIWPDGYYMSYTRLRAQTLQRDGVGAMVFNRDSMINGDPSPAAIQFSLSFAESPFIFLPSDCDGPFPPAGTPNYFGHTMNGFFVLREFHTDWQTPANSSFSNLLKLPIAPYSSVLTGGIPQKGSDKLLSALDERLMCRLQFRQFGDHQAMVANHTVGIGQHAGIRWYELQKTDNTWFVRQQSTYSPDTLSRWMGSMAMDSSGNIALGYSVSASSVYPSIRFTGRTTHDPPGQMTVQETTIVDGGGCQTGSWSGQNRWGDYSSMSVDPASSATFWYTQEYYATTSLDGWQTRIASFSFADILDIQVSASPPAVCAGGATQLDIKIAGGTAPFTYLWTSDPPGFSSDIKNPTVSPDASATYIVQVTSGAQVKVDSVPVQVVPGPVAFAGNDTTICRYTGKVTLSGAVSNCHSVHWITSGDGLFTQPDALNTEYWLGLNDQQSDSIRLKLTAYPVAPCLPVSATKRVVIDKCEGLNDLPGNRFSVNLYPNPVRDKLFVQIKGVQTPQLTILISNLLAETISAETVVLKSGAITRQIDVSRFPKGVCFLRVQTPEETIVRPFVVH
ncbi:MAG: T9SS type A sorting domain-containing protein [Bacteroidales bacterium]